MVHLPSARGIFGAYRSTVEEPGDGISLSRIRILVSNPSVLLTGCQLEQQSLRPAERPIEVRFLRYCAHGAARRCGVARWRRMAGPSGGNGRHRATGNGPHGSTVTCANPRGRDAMGSGPYRRAKRVRRAVFQLVAEPLGMNRGVSPNYVVIFRRARDRACLAAGVPQSMQ